MVDSSAISQKIPLAPLIRACPVRRSIAGGSRIFAIIKNYLRKKMFLVVNESIGSKTNVRGTIRVTPPYKGVGGILCVSASLRAITFFW